MHGQVGELGHAKARQDRAQLPLAGGQVGAGQQFAGDAPAGLWGQVVPLQGRHGLAQEGFGGPVGGRRFQVVDAGG